MMTFNSTTVQSRHNKRNKKKLNLERPKNRKVGWLQSNYFFFFKNLGATRVLKKKKINWFAKTWNTTH